MATVIEINAEIDRRIQRLLEKKLTYAVADQKRRGEAILRHWTTVITDDAVLAAIRMLRTKYEAALNALTDVVMDDRALARSYASELQLIEQLEQLVMQTPEGPSSTPLFIRSRKEAKERYARGSAALRQMNASIEELRRKALALAEHE